MITASVPRRVRHQRVWTKLELLALASLCILGLVGMWIGGITLVQWSMS